MGNYSIVRLRSVGSDHVISKMYSTNFELEAQSYQIQHDAFTREHISYPTSFSASMNKLGNQSHEIFYDCEIMQKKWSEENGSHYNNTSWQTDIILAQLKPLKPDVLYFQDIFSMPPEMRVEIKDLVPSIKLKIIHKGFPGETRDLSDADLLTVSSPILLERYKNLKPHLVYHSFDDSVLAVMSNLEGEHGTKRNDVSFIGSFHRPERRYWMLIELLKKTDIQVWGFESAIQTNYKKSGKEALKNLLRPLAKKIVESFCVLGIPASKYVRYLPKYIENYINKVNEGLKKQNKIINYGIKEGGTIDKTIKEMYPERCHDSVYGIEYYQLIHNSNIVFNMHHPTAANTVDNMKMFEVTGSGSCLLTDTGVNMKDIFEEDKEIVTYKSIDEAIEKITYLLNHPSEMEQIAKAGQARTLRDHTIMNRCQQIDKLIKNKL